MSEQLDIFEAAPPSARRGRPRKRDVVRPTEDRWSSFVRCVDCGAPVQRKRLGYQAPRRCPPCNGKQEIWKGRRNKGYDPNPKCQDCGAPVQRKHAGAPRPKRCLPCRKKEKIERYRRWSGYDPNPKCQDCGAPVQRRGGGAPPRRCPPCRQKFKSLKYEASRLNKKYRLELVVRQEAKCAICKERLPANSKGIHVDHVIPLSRGGGNDIGNLQATCAGCNMMKREDYE